MKKISLLLLFFTFSLFNRTQIQAAGPMLQDFWDSNAAFKNGEEITFPGTPYNSQYDFYYDTHSSGMAVIEDQNQPGTIYYFAESWKNNSPDYLEPHLYKSVDGGKTFTHLTKLFDITDTGTCLQNSTYAYWNYNGKTWCLFQMREPDVTYYNGAYYIVYEAAARSGSETIIGPALIKLTSLDIQQPQVVQHGVNFRQHPVFATYDGNPEMSGLQETSASSPFFYFGQNGLYLFWTGINPLNGSWQRVDTYRGHFSTGVGSSSADCFDPILCYFSFDEYLIKNPNFPKGEAGMWDFNNTNGTTVLKENNYYYMFYIGSDNVDCRTNEENRWGMSLTRSLSLTNWERKYGNNGIPLIKYAGLYNTLGNPSDGCSLYGKLVKIDGQYWIYYTEMRSPNINGTPISRNYRVQLATISTLSGDLNADNHVNIFDYNLFIPNFGKTGTSGWIPSDIDKNGSVNIFDFNILLGNFGK